MEEVGHLPSEKLDVFSSHFGALQHVNCLLFYSSLCCDTVMLDMCLCTHKLYALQKSVPHLSQCSQKKKKSLERSLCLAKQNCKKFYDELHAVTNFGPAVTGHSELL